METTGTAAASNAQTTEKDPFAYLRDPENLREAELKQAEHHRTQLERRADMGNQQRIEHTSAVLAQAIEHHPAVVNDVHNEETADGTRHKISESTVVVDDNNGGPESVSTFTDHHSGGMTETALVIENAEHSVVIRSNEQGDVGSVVIDGAPVDIETNPEKFAEVEVILEGVGNDVESSTKPTPDTEITSEDSGEQPVSEAVDEVIATTELAEGVNPSVIREEVAAAFEQTVAEPGEKSENSAEAAQKARDIEDIKYVVSLLNTQANIGLMREVLEEEARTQGVTLEEINAAVGRFKLDDFKFNGDFRSAAEYIKAENPKPNSSIWESHQASGMIGNISRDLRKNLKQAYQSVVRNTLSS